jgi:hypothetical protein
MGDRAVVELTDGHKTIQGYTHWGRTHLPADVYTVLKALEKEGEFCDIDLWVLGLTTEMEKHTTDTGVTWSEPAYRSDEVFEINCERCQVAFKVFGQRLILDFADFMSVWEETERAKVRV